ncbi:hypothetical protein ACS0TY_021302 [Phlomoides rotata]
MSRAVREEEEDVLELGDGGNDIPARVRTDPVCLVGKLCTDKIVNSFALSEVMVKAFRSKGKLNARDWGHAGKIGTLTAYEKHDPIEPEEFVRVKVEVDITRPLRKGLSVRFAGEVLWIPIKYESLPSYCYCCGVIGHFFKTCKFYDRDEDLEPSALSFGPILKAPTMKRLKGRKVDIVYLDDGGWQSTRVGVSNFNENNVLSDGDSRNLINEQTHVGFIAIPRVRSVHAIRPQMHASPNSNFPNPRIQPQPVRLSTVETTIPTSRAFNTLHNNLADIHSLSETLYSNYSITNNVVHRNLVPPSGALNPVNLPAHLTLPQTYPLIFQPTFISIQTHNPITQPETPYSRLTTSSGTSVQTNPRKFAWKRAVRAQNREVGLMTVSEECILGKRCSLVELEEGVDRREGKKRRYEVSGEEEVEAFDVTAEVAREKPRRSQ